MVVERAFLKRTPKFTISLMIYHLRSYPDLAAQTPGSLKRRNQRLWRPPLHVHHQPVFVRRRRLEKSRYRSTITSENNETNDQKTVLCMVFKYRVTFTCIITIYTLTDTYRHTNTYERRKRHAQIFPSYFVFANNPLTHKQFYAYLFYSKMNSYDWNNCILKTCLGNCEIFR